MESKEHIYIMFPLFNRIEMTLKCLQGFYSQDYPNFSVHLFDDGSTDDTQNLIAKHFPKTEVIRGEGDYWWTKSINQVLRKLITQAGENDFFLTSNNDTWIEPNFLSTLIKESKENNRSIVGSRLKNAANVEMITPCGYYYSPEIVGFTPAPAVIEGKRVIDALGCRGTIIPSEVFRKVGEFDEINLPHYAADIEFFLRAHKAGFNILESDTAYTFDLEPPETAQAEFAGMKLYDVLFSIRSKSNLKARFAIIDKHGPGGLKNLKLKVVSFLTLVKTYFAQR